jgi:ribosome biogenesis GTPase
MLVQRRVVRKPALSFDRSARDDSASMKRKPKKTPRHKNLTDEYVSGSLDDDRVERQQRFGQREKFLQQNKTLRTALMRAEEQAGDIDVEALPVGTVVQVYSLYCEVEHEATKFLCVVRKTLAKVSDTQLVVGDLVRFRIVEDETGAAEGAPQGVIEQVLPRRTVLARADSFKAIDVHPIVANADQMLIVASLHQPDVKWGLVDRMLIAAQSGGLKPIVCLNKVDLVDAAAPEDADYLLAREALAHYEVMGITTLESSVTQHRHTETLRELLRDRVTVLAGHSGVGKSSLIHAVQPTLDLRIAAISGYTGKGRHTTTAARRYPLDFGGYVIDTPGVKVFGLWGVTRENLESFFPDVLDSTAPEWRQASCRRILASLAESP